jgi:hypothetical protein
VKFAGNQELQEKMGIGSSLVLQGLTKLTEYNGLQYQELPESVKLHLLSRPIKVVTLSDKSDKVVRFDLFERLNTGGIALTDQEIRDCVYRGKFGAWLDKRAENKNFRRVVRLTKSQKHDGTREECVLRFFAFYFHYEEFEHSVKEFLNHYMEEASKSFDYRSCRKLFDETFKQLAGIFADGLRRPSQGRKIGTTSLILYEGVSVGAALALRKQSTLAANGVEVWLQSPELRSYTTGATNDINAVRGRIEFCRDRFLGKPYVPQPGS